MGRDARIRMLVVAALTSAVGSLALAGVAAAEKVKVSPTAEGRAAALATVVQRADLGTSAVWTGGAQKPVISGTLPCSTFHPKQSDLVLTGAAKTVWKATGVEIDSQSQVLRTPRMVQLDWQRTVLAPEVVPCLRSGLAAQLGDSGRLVSFGRIAFPKLATYTRAYRGLVDVTTPTASVRVLVDLVAVGRGRTEITLMTTAPAASAPAIAAAELRLARLLVSRIRA